jgi:hypothetical protein
MAGSPAFWPRAAPAAMPRGRHERAAQEVAAARLHFCDLDGIEEALGCVLDAAGALHGRYISRI